MTDPSGRSFLSYRRIRQEEAAILIAAQHDHGIPTWQDLRNLDEEPLETELKRIISDPLTANAVMWLTPEVKESLVIRKVEAPGFFKRAEAKDGFFLVPVVAGGLNYDGAAEVLDNSCSMANLKEWNLKKLENNPITYADASAVAAGVLHRRISEIHKSLPKESPIVLRVYTRETPHFESGIAVLLDWTHRFKGREVLPSAWENYIIPSLKTIVKTLQRDAPGRVIEAGGLLSIPAAITVGYEFLAPRGIKVVWKQNMMEPGKTQLWGLSEPSEESGFQSDITDHDMGASSLAVLISIASNVETAFLASKKDLPPFRASVSIKKPGTIKHNIRTPGEASHIANLIIDSIRKARTVYPDIRDIHLFFSAPVGLAMMVGQLLNTLGPVQTYEHLPINTVGVYKKSILLNPI